MRRPIHKTSRVTTWIMRNSFGLVTNEKTASWIVLGMVILVLLVSLLQVRQAVSPTVEPLTGQRPGSL